jgi:hypothetical protein
MRGSEMKGGNKVRKDLRKRCTRVGVVPPPFRLLVGAESQISDFPNMEVCGDLPKDLLRTQKKNLL